MNILNVILSAAVSSVIAIFSISNMSKEKVTFKKFVVFVLVLTCIGAFICANFKGVTRIVLTVNATTIALYLSLFDKDISKAMCYTIVFELYAFIVEAVLSVLFVTLFNFNLQSYNNFSLSLLMFSILNSLLIYALTLIKPLNKCIYNCISSISKKKYDIIYINTLFLLLVFMLALNGDIINKDLSFYINIGMILFILITLIYVVYRNAQNQQLENKYKEMMEYVCKYEKIINEQGKKNHEYNNQLMVIKGYSRNPEKLEEYLRLIIEEHKCGQNYTIRQLSYFPDGGIKGLVYDKLSKMEENNIKSLLYIDPNVKDVFEDKFDIKTYQDITKLLGVFLDNAIEATLEAEEKEIEIDIKVQEDCVIISICNTYKNSDTMKNIGKKGFTTKGFGHGYGLSIVKDIAKHNENIETFNDKDDKFKQTIIVYYEKNRT